MSTVELGVIQHIPIYQQLDRPDLRVFYVADLDVDVDGARCAYRLDNDPDLALDDIHASAGYPNDDWKNVLAVDPNDKSEPYVDSDGYCVSKTSYFWDGYDETDRQRWVDAVNVPYAVAPGLVRARCQGILLGCAARVTRLTDHASIDCVCADMSGNNIGEASDKAAKFFDPKWSARNGDDRKIYLYEFFPNRAAQINGVTYKLIPV